MGVPPPFVPVNSGPWIGSASLGLAYGAMNIGRASAPDGGGLHFTIIPLPAQPVDELTMQARADAIGATYAGLLMQAVDLYRLTVGRNGYMAGILATMAHGFLGLPLSWHGDPEMVAALMDIRDSDGRITTPGDFSRMHPENEAAAIFEDGIGIGLGLGQYLLMCWRCDGVEWLHDDGVESCKRCGAHRGDRPIGVRELYQLAWRDPRWLWRNTVTKQWYYTGRQGMIPVNPGDGEWLFFQTVPDQDLWIHGPWPLGTEAAIFSRDARYDLQATSATCAPAHVFQFEGASDPRTRKDVDEQADNLRFQNKLTLPGNVKHEIHAAQGGDGGYVGTADRITAWARVEWEVYVTGIQQGTENGQGFANNGVLQRVSRERRAFYAGAWIRQLCAQGLKWWARDNFCRPCPIGHIDTSSPEDKLAKSKADTEEGKAVQALADGYAAVGFELVPAYLEERAQTKGLRIRPLQRPVLVDDDYPALVLGSEGRAAMGRPPFGDQRDGQTLVALQNAGKGGGGNAPSPAPPAAPPQPPDARLEAADEDEPADDDDAARLAAEMTQHGIQRCEHGKVNRCRLCGVERVRGVLTDGAGAHVGWRVAWRPTRARIGTPSRALYNPNQPRDHGMFASAGGSGTGGHDDSKNEREPSGGHGTDKADAGGDKAPPPGQPPGASASARAGTQQAEAHGQGSSP